MILDAGCGEGSHLYSVCREYLHEKMGVVGIGIDIAKEGILVGAKHYYDLIFCAADLTEPPFCDEQFHVILNILSPSNYKAFRRLLKKDGFLLKVVPIVAYLQEIRQALFVDPMKRRTRMRRL